VMAMLTPLNDAFMEGWAMYSEKMMLEQGFFKTPEERLMVLSGFYDNAFRAKLSVDLHTGETTPDEAAAIIAKRSGHSMELAKTIVHNIAETPVKASSYFLGMIQILQLREQVMAKAGAHFELKKFNDLMLLLGAFPVHTLGKLMFNEDLKPLTTEPGEIRKLYQAP
jgi:uncharacterized protein (DUF885 family)